MALGMSLGGCFGAHAPDASAAASAVTTTAPPVLGALEDSMRSVLSAALADSAFPGAIAIAGNRNGELATVAVGRLTWGEPAAVDRHTIWDLASLTKVVGTTTAIMRLVDEGRIDIDRPVQQYLPDWTGAGRQRVTVRQLLTHSSGLPSFKPYDRVTTDRDSIDRLMFETPLDSVPGQAMVYSDIGGYLLGEIVERVSGQPLDRYVGSLLGSVGMTSTSFVPAAALLPRIAPTEVDPRRGGLVRGKVHDERAYYLGGVSGHAGLFGSADDLSRFARLMLSGGRRGDTTLVSAATLHRFTTVDDSLFSNRALGWQTPAVRGTRFSTAGPWASSRSMSASAYGHTGFTGTSLLIDPDHDLYILLLSNRVNPTRANTKIGAVRTRLTNAVYAAIAASRGSTPH